MKDRRRESWWVKDRRRESWWVKDRRRESWWVSEVLGVLGKEGGRGEEGEGHMPTGEFHESERTYQEGLTSFPGRKGLNHKSQSVSVQKHP